MFALQSRRFKFKVTSASESNVSLTFEEYDQAYNFDFNDRFNMKLLIRPSLNAIELDSVDGELDLDNGSGVAVFAREGRIDVG